MGRNKTRADEDTVVDGLYIFIQTDSRRLELFDRAVQSCEEAQLSIKILTSSEFEKFEEPVDCQCIYVIDNFQTPTFKILVKQNYRVYGAGCLLHCIESNQSLPQKSPVYSQCLKGAIVSVTGLKKEKRAEVEQAIQWLGGEFTGALIKSTTHLIAAETSSKKYQTAGKIGIPILSEDWLVSCTIESKTGVFDGTGSSYISRYKLPIFTGCSITTSGLSDRERIKQLVTQNSGLYTGQMTVATCTHLVLDEPKGAKYNAARNWASVHIVKPQWIYDSIQAGYKLPENDSQYSLRESSTPEKHGAPMGLPDVSAITDHTALSSVDQTIDSTHMSRKSDDRVILEQLKEENINCDVLDNIKICLRGFNEALSENLTKLITLCSGTRVHSVTTADYIVVHRLDEQTRQHIQFVKSLVVSGEWLQDIARTRKFIEPTGKYLLLKPESNKEQEKNNSSSNHPVKRKSSVLSPDATQMDTSVVDLDAEASQHDGDLDFMSQYSFNAANTTPANKRPRLSLRPTDDDATFVTPPPPRNYRRKSPPTNAAALPTNTMAPPTNTETPPTNGNRGNVMTPATAMSQLQIQTPGVNNPPPTPLPPGPFSGKRFLVLCDNTKITISVRLLGGTVIWTESNDSDFTIVPIYLIKPIKSKSTQLTTVWVEACERERGFVSPETSPLFKPVLIPENCTLLSGLAFTTTQLSTYSRNALSEIINKAGGNYCDNMKKEIINNEPATTHLITDSTQGQKYNAALTWKLDVVTVRYIIDSLTANKLLNVTDYNPANINNLKTADKPKRTSLTSTPVLQPVAMSETPLHNRVQMARLSLRGGKSKSSLLSQKKSRPSLDFLSTSILENPDSSFHPQFNVEMTPDNQIDNQIDTPNADTSLSTNLMIANRRHVMITPITPDETGSNTLHGIVVYVCEKLSSLRVKLNKLVEEMGGANLEMLDASATHVVYEGSTSTKEYKDALKYQQFIVNKSWLDQCYKERKKVDETPYRCDLIEENSETITTDTYTPIRVGLVKKTSNLSDRLNDQRIDDKNTDNRPIEPTTETQESMNEVMNLYKKFKSYLHTRKEETRNSSSGENPSPSKSADSHNDNTVNKRQDGITPKRNHIQETITSTETQSQYNNLLVSWDDTTSKFEQERVDPVEDTDLTTPITNAQPQTIDSDIIDQLDDNFTQEINAAAEQHMLPEQDDLQTADFTDVSMNVTEDQTTTTTITRIFQLSGFEPEERDEMAQKLSSLGAQVVQSSNFDPRCTHIILKKPNRNEKFLCALVKGSWILHKNYVGSSHTAGHLLDESGYEWGSISTEEYYKHSSTLTTYARAAHRWRSKKHDLMSQGNHNGVFSSWKVIIIMPAEKLSSLNRLLELGGAIIVQSSEITKLSTADRITHAFIDSKKVPSKKSDMDYMSSIGISCLKPEYIPCYLIDEILPDVKDVKFSLNSQKTSKRTSTRSTRRSNIQ